MSEPCVRCGGSHPGACPTPEPSSPPAADVEACAFCGERHPTNVSCARWAQQGGAATPAVFGAAAAADRPPVAIAPRRPRRTAGQSPAIAPLALRCGIGLLALIGAVSAVRFVAGRVGGAAGGTSVALPACNTSRIRANLNTAAAIESEIGAAVPARVAAVNALLLGSGDGCGQRIYLLYTAYIDDAALCLGLSSPSACQARDSAHAQLNQALESGE